MPTPASLTLNLAPMVDVMMCLIIFFLLASRLVEAERYKVDLPWAVAAQEVQGHELGARVTITVRKAGADGHEAEYVVVDWDGEQIIERILQPEDIEALLRARAAHAAADGQEIRCVIQADENVQYQHVETVLRACGVAHIANVVFSANQGLPPESAGGA
jgi:biopolymer transport protein ExbD